MTVAQREGGARPVVVRLKSIAWALRTALSINAPLLIAVFALVAALSVLPAISLIFNRDAIEQLSTYLAGGGGSFEQVVPSLVAYGLILALITISSRVNTDFLANLTDNVYAYGMQERLMTAIHEADMLELMRKNVNEDFNYIVRQARALNRLVGGVCSIGGKVFSLASLAVAAWGLSRPVLVITLAYAAVAVVLAFAFSKGTRANYTKFRKAEVKALFLQNMPMESNMAKEVRVYGCADQVVGTWREAFSERLHMVLGTYFATERSAFVLGVTFYVFLAAVVAYLVVQVAAGSADPAVLLTVFTLCTNLFASMSALARDLIAFDESLFAIEQQRALLFEPAHASRERSCCPEPHSLSNDGPDAVSSSAARADVDPPSAADTCVPGIFPKASPLAGLSRDDSRDVVFAVRGVTFSYDGRRQSLRGVDVDIRRGEVVALVGENGSGKTTLVKLLMGVFSPDEGEILFEGRPISACSPDELSAKIGAFFQDFYLFHHTLSENISYGHAPSIGDEAAVREALERGGAAHLMAKMPRGLATMIGKRIDREGVEFSGGERQLLATARTYMGEKDVLIFDEPASMLDPLAEMEQFRAIRNRIAGKTGILISHRVGFARLADRIVMMRDGRVVEQGAHDELMAKDGAYAAFFREQACWYDQGGKARLSVSRDEAAGLGDRASCDDCPPGSSGNCPSSSADGSAEGGA